MNVQTYIDFTYYILIIININIVGRGDALVAGS